MKKRVFGRNLSRGTTARRALWRSLVRSFMITNGIKTTMAKAKSVQPEVEKLVTLASKNTLAARRQVLSILGNDKLTTEAIFKVSSGFAGIKSGFTRIIPLANRQGDNARMAKLEWAREPKKEEVVRALEKPKSKAKKAEVKTEKTKTKKTKSAVKVKSKTK